MPLTPLSITLLLQLLLNLCRLFTLLSLLYTLLANLLQMLPQRRAGQGCNSGQSCDDFTNSHPVFSG